MCLMCGIIGVYDTEEVIVKIYDAMLTLQHRGQDSAGILTYDGKFHLKRGNGLVRDIFGFQIEVSFVKVENGYGMNIHSLDPELSFDDPEVLKAVRSAAQEELNRIKNLSLDDRKQIDAAYIEFLQGTVKHGPPLSIPAISEKPTPTDNAMTVDSGSAEMTRREFLKNSSHIFL